MEALRDEIDRLRLEVAELRASRTRLVVAADADRRRIERELHDTVRQHLVALAVNLQRAGSLMTEMATAKELVDEMTRDVEQALDETAQLAQRIYPALLSASGLAAALRSAAADTGIRASVDVRAGASIAPELATSLYLSCLEAFDRVSGPVMVTVREHERALGFEVVEVGAAVDDPARSTMTRAPASGELERLRDRIEALGGRLEVRSKPGGRLDIVGRLPVR